METAALFSEGKILDAQTKQWSMLAYAFLFGAMCFPWQQSLRNSSAKCHCCSHASVDACGTQRWHDRSREHPVESHEKGSPGTRETPYWRQRCNYVLKMQK